MRLKVFALLFAVFCLCVPAASASAAYAPYASACNASSGVGNVKSQATACNPTKTTIVGPNGIIKKVSNVVALIAAITAIIVIMIGGLQYIVSNGDSQKTANARMAIIGGAVGLGIIVAAQGIILLVLSRLNN